MRIGIVGCGTAGPAAACFLARAGHRVTILERAADLRPVGAGLLIQPTGMHVLARLGILVQALALGHRVDRLDGRNIRGRRILDLAYSDLQPGLFGLGLHRGALFSLLLEAARAADSIDIRTDCPVEEVLNSGESVAVRDCHGATHGPFDLLIVADGARSKVRDDLGLTTRNRRYAYAAVWFVAEPVGNGFDHTLSQVYRGTHSMIGFLPSGRATSGGPQTISVFWSLPHDDFARLRDSGVDAWKRDAIALAPHAEPLIAQVQTSSDLVFAAYHDVATRPVFRGRVVVLGDAAHAMSPQLGQGANLALIDAADLADCLAAETDVSAALRRHDSNRRAHTAFYSRASRWLTPWFQSSLAPLAPIRDALGRPASRVPFFRRQMLLSLAGVKDGWLSHQTLPALPAATASTAAISTADGQPVTL